MTKFLSDSRSAGRPKFATVPIVLVRGQDDAQFSFHGIGKDTFSMRVRSATFETSVLEASRASGEAALMSLSEDQADCCPHCRSLFEIVHVKFRFNGTALISTCPNCAIAAVEWCAAESNILDIAKKLAMSVRSFWQRVATRMDSLDRQFRYVVAFLIGAVFTAAALRHTVHVYGGIPRDEIRWYALMAIPVVALAITFFRRKR
jgi:hypothetical protein